MSLIARIKNPDRRLLWATFIFYAVTGGVTTLALYGLTLSGNLSAPIGGDFIAFQGAAKAAAIGDAAKVYDYQWFKTFLDNLYPVRKDTALSWQYPPSYLFVVLPFAVLPYALAFPIWAAGTAAGYGAVMRLLTKDPLALFAMIASPVALAAFTTGQNGFFTAALLALAACYPRSRPIVAGLAAGLLTIKPHLGLLIPVAFAAAGCWRAFGAAAMTAIILAGLSLLCFGIEAWASFFQSLSDTSVRIQPGMLPLEKMASPLSAVLFIGLPPPVANGIQALATLGAIIFVWRLWRRESDAMLRGAGLIAATLIASPYGFHYELIILALPVVIVAMMGAREGWLKHERAMIAVVWTLPIFWGLIAGSRTGVSIGFVTALIVFALVWRRVKVSAA